jgi:glycosyltransferase involved in cell wall biosynthesis
VKNTDVLIVSSTAASFFYFRNIFRKKIILTNPDGLEHRRKKWSLGKRGYLWLSEFFAVRFSDYLIADSDAIKKYFISSYKGVEHKIRLIEYGAFQNRYTDNEVLKKYGLEHNSYLLVVCRLEPENNLDMILEAYSGAATLAPIVIVGNIQNNGYTKSLIDRYRSDRIKFIGGIYDRNELNALRFSCKAYIHGHSVGGTNPSLLEAMGSRNIIIAHDNEFNREVTEGNQLYFSTSEQCKKKINEIELMKSDEIERYKESSNRMIVTKYNWDNILRKYLDLFNEISVNAAD